MSKFKSREEVNRNPCFMADQYEFFKVNLEEFKNWVSEKEENWVVHREEGPVFKFLEEKYPNMVFSVTSSWIYYNDKNTSEPIGFEKYMGMDVPMYNSENLPVNKRSETQKWVSRLEEKVCEFPETFLSKTDVQSLIKEVAG